MKNITVTDVGELSQNKHLHSFEIWVTIERDINEKTRGSNDSWSETDDCVRNLVQEDENVEYEYFKEDTSETNDTNESKLGKIKTEEALITSVLAKTFRSR